MYHLSKHWDADDFRLVHHASWADWLKGCALAFSTTMTLFNVAPVGVFLIWRPIKRVAEMGSRQDFFRGWWATLLSFGYPGWLVLLVGEDGHATTMWARLGAHLGFFVSTGVVLAALYFPFHYVWRQWTLLVVGIPWGALFVVLVGLTIMDLRSLRPWNGYQNL